MAVATGTDEDDEDDEDDEESKEVEEEEEEGAGGVESLNHSRSGRQVQKSFPALS
jgi:hypothetical protein